VKEEAAGLLKQIYPDRIPSREKIPALPLEKKGRRTTGSDFDIETFRDGSNEQHWEGG
jgi:hypothetical protein